MHRVVRSTIVRASGERYEPGDEIEPTDAELRAFGDNLEIVKDEYDDVVDAETVVEELEESDEEQDSETEICGTLKADDTICERPADECPYHDED